MPAGKEADGSAHERISVGTWERKAWERKAKYDGKLCEV